MRKRLTKTIWYGSDVDSNGNPILPSTHGGLDGLNYGELFLHLSNGKASLWTLSSDGKIVEITGGGSDVDMSSYLLKSIWDKVFEIRTDSQGTEYIFGKLPMVTQYGITMYSGDGVDIPSLASGLPFDGRTIWYNPETNQIEVIGGTGGGGGEGGGVSNFWDLNNIPSWITNSKPKYSYSEIEGTPDLSGYQPLITSSNKLAYSLISGTPTSLKNPNALSFGSKSYDGSANITLTAGDLGALTSHQNIYNLTMQAGAFTAVTFDPNGAAKTVNIPTTTSHISEGSNLYFTNARATGAITGGASTIATSNLTASRALISNSSGKVAVSAVTSTELGYLDGVTSSIQTQLNAKVALSGTQTITGEKNFTGGLKVNGSPIVYDATNKYWKLEGDLLVTGGVTMYGSDSSFTPSTITDAVNIDNVTIKRNSQGQLYAVGGGAADSVLWDNIDGKPTFASVATSGKYSDLSGTPTSLKNPTSLTFGSKSYDGSAARTITASDLGALTSHQDISHLLSKTDASSTYQTKITSSNKLAYSLISGTPTLASVATSGKYDDLIGKPTLLSSFTDDVVSGKYLSLNGGTLNGDLTIKGSSPKLYFQRGTASDGTWDTYVYNNAGLITWGIAYSGNTYDVFAIGKSAMRPIEDNVYPLGSTSYRLSDVNTVLLNGYTPITSNNIGSYAWMSSNDGSGSGLDADLLDGVQLNELFTSLSSGPTNNVSITIGGVTKKLTSLYASYTENFTVVWNNPTSGTYELNDLVGGLVRHYGSGGSLNNAPESFGNGAVLALSNGTKGLSGQLAWNIVHNSTTNVTNKLWWRAADSTNGFTYSQWKQIAFTDSNVASATKLQTARTIWGQSFDGTGNVSGVLILGDGNITRNDESGTARTLISFDGNSTLFNYGLAGQGYKTYIEGNEIIFRYGTGHTRGMTILSSGNVGIGTSSPSSKLSVYGGVTLDGLFESGSVTKVKDLGYKALVISTDHDRTNWGMNLWIEGNGNGYIQQQAFTNSGTTYPLVLQPFGGNVGIGITAPEYRLHVEQKTDSTWASVFQTPKSKVYLAQSSGRGIYAGVLSGVSTSYLLNLKYNQTTLGNGGTSALYVRTDGNIGIGTENPDYKLHVVGTSHINGAASFNSSVILKGTGSSTARIIMSRSSYNYINYPTDGILCLGTSNSTASTQLCINGATGNVGIGTTSPSSKLHVSGDILATGGITMYSQRSLKNVVDERGLSLSELSAIKPTRYTWKDRRDNRLHFGGIADDIQQVLPEVVYKTTDGILTMDYGNAAFAVASSLIQPVVDHENRIAMLEEENKKLRLEVERLKSA